MEDLVLDRRGDVEAGADHRNKTMADLIARWREGVGPTLKPSTRLSYEWGFKRIEPAFCEVPIQDVERPDVQAFLVDAARTLSPESVRDLRARLQALFSLAEEWGWIKPGSNPARGRLRLPPREHVRCKVVLFQGESHRLVAALPQPYSTVVVLAVLAGLRRGELAALRWEDNPTPGKLVVDEAVYRGKLGTPKTRKSKREVAIGDLAQKAIDEWRPSASFTGSQDFMFAIRTNTPIDMHNAMARHVKPVAQQLGISKVSWHDLRHTFTTWGRLAGIRAETMRDQLGHSSIAMTLDVYSHAQDLTKEAALLDQYASQPAAEKVM